MKKSIVVVILALAAGGLGFAGWQKAGARAPATAAVETPPPTVSVVSATRAEVVETVTASGTLVARNEALIGPEIEGLRIVEILADEGDRVAAGAVLARLSRETLEAQAAQSDAGLARADAAIAQAGSQIAQAEASLAWSEADLSRAQQLLKTGASTQAAVDQKSASARAGRASLQAARDALRAAQAERRSIEAQRRELDVRLARTEVRTPVPGVIARHSAKLGAVASAAGEPMFRLVQDGEIELEAEVPEARLGALAQGQQADVALADGATAKGRVRLVSPEVDRATRLGRVRIAVPAGKNVRVGSFARATIEVRRDRSIVVPSGAVAYDAQGASVLVADGRTVRQRRLTVGLIDDGRAEVRDGLAEGEAVVARASAFLRDGDSVTPVREQATAQAEAR